MTPRVLGVVTTTRADYGVYLPVLRAIQTADDLELRLYVTGMHLSPTYGRTISLIEADGFAVSAALETLMASDSPEGIAKSMGMSLMSFAQLFAQAPPNILIVLGDRFEMCTAALAAVPFGIPIAHIHGGEVTEGAIDDLRHMLTKISHLHFASTEIYGKRIIQMGEEPWRVTVSGAPSLDNLQQITPLTVEQLRARFGLHFQHPPLLVTFHPVTLEYEQTEEQITELLAALDGIHMPIVFTLPNADTRNHIITDAIRQFMDIHPQAELVETFGTQGYFSMMAGAAAMVGNSSSGVVEAASFKLPVVNIGTRQQGRIRAHNVIDVGYSREAIETGLREALSPAFRAHLADLVNPYASQGRPAAEIIVERLKSVSIDQHLMMKKFHDLPTDSGHNDGQ